MNVQRLRENAVISYQGAIAALDDAIVQLMDRRDELKSALEKQTKLLAKEKKEEA